MRLLVIVLLLVSISFADSDREEHGGSEHRQKHMPLDMRYLHLNKKQLKQAKKIIKKFRKDYKVYYHAREASEKRVKTLFSASNFDSRKFEKIVSEPNYFLLKMQSEFFSGMHMILTPKQRKRFTYYMEEWEVE